MSEQELSRPSRRIERIGWAVISVVGGGAAIVSLLVCGILLLALDVFVLKKDPATTEYLTIVRRTGGWSVPAAGEAGGTYEVRNAQGVVSTAHLPWLAEPGSRVRVRLQKTRLLRLTIPSEAPGLCSCPECDLPCDGGQRIEPDTPGFARESKTAPPPRYRMDVVYIFEARNPGPEPESIIVIGGSGFRSLAALRQFVARLPRGTVLEWAPGCERLGGELLLSSDRDMEEFKALCKDRGIVFILHPAG